MKEKIKYTIPVVLAGALLAVLAAACSGTPDGRPAEAQKENARADEQVETASQTQCGTDEGLPCQEQDEACLPGEEGADRLFLTMEQIADKKCEHGMPAYQCASCRYELGVVKVAADLLKDNGPAGGRLIRTERAAKRLMAAGLNITGVTQLDENASVHISPRIPGIIESVHVDIGARVRRGDILFEINSVELGRALSDYERSLKLTALSRKSYEREKSLFEGNIASEQDMIEAQMTYEAHQTDLNTAEKTLLVLGLTVQELAKMKEGGAHAAAGYLPVRAPIQGTIIRKHAVIGELVQPGGDIMLLADLRTVWVWADIYEQDLQQLLDAEKRGPISVEVFVRAFPDRIFPGQIDYIGATMDEQTRTVKVRTIVQNSERLLRPGMFCEMRVGAGRPEEVLAVPETALFSDEGYDFVFIHWKDDYYVRRPVIKGRAFSDAVEITSGLKPGDVLVSDGAFLLKSDILREKMGAGCAD
jgi:cobalt-zinc-cadmium efflux system membrane fusion protein